MIFDYITIIIKSENDSYELNTDKNQVLLNFSLIH